MEDALDCYAAIIFVPSAAQDWEADNLKASEAGKKWVMHASDLITHDNISLDEYRKRIRSDFNSYAHGSRALCEWNLFFKPYAKPEDKAEVEGTLEINFEPDVIELNGHAIDAYETAHLLEFLAITQRGYSRFLSTHASYRNSLADLLPKIEKIMISHDAHGCQEVRVPPEIAKLKS
jgi:hypothetical protein